jgi:arsenate reductase-like glutaredoxin family protein
MPLKLEVVSAEITHDHWNYMANGTTVTLKLKNGSTRIVTLAEADAEGIEYREVTEKPEEKHEITKTAEKVEDVTEEKTDTTEVKTEDQPEVKEPVTKADFHEALELLGVEHPANLKLDELKTLYEDASKVEDEKEVEEVKIEE